MSEINEKSPASAKPPKAVSKPPTNKLARKSPASAKTSSGVSKRYSDVLAELKRLRSLVNEVCRVYIAKVERDILAIASLVEGSREQSLRKKKSGASALNDVAEILGGLSLKPQKGRRSDIKKIEKAVQTMKRVLSKKKN